MANSDVQRYGKVFFEVDTDKDGKINGVQARDLFLSWKIPRGIFYILHVHQVWLCDSSFNILGKFSFIKLVLSLSQRF
jgi:hypothetical protein